jgi:protein SCO1
LLCAAAFLCGVFAASCEKQPTTKRYQMTGRVTGINKPTKTLNVDSDAIPGYMDAMEMPYPVRDPKYLDQVNVGDKIKADLIVSGDSSPYIENIVVTEKGAPPPPPLPK